MAKLRFAGVILTGGQSSRMGKDKARLVTPNGETLLDRTCRIVSEFANRGCWISGASGSRAYPMIADSKPGCGPLSGISAALEALRSRADIIIFVPVDMPGLQADFLKLLADACSIEGVEVAHYRGHPLPLAIRAHSRCIEAARLTLELEYPSVKSLIEKLQSSEMDPAGYDRSLANVNTPEEWNYFWSGAGL